jgi:Protein of unknown function (DUF3098)
MKQSPQKTTKKPSTLQFAFERKNYILLASGVLTLLVGFLLMSGGGSSDPNVFSEEIFSARRITLAPAVVLIGFGIVGYAIMYKPKKSATTDSQ